MLTFPTLSALMCNGNNVCSYFAFQISRFMSVNKLKYFFAVDTRYVMKKLIILMFPYTHQVIGCIPRHALSSKRTRNVSSRPECDDKLSFKHTTCAVRVSGDSDCVHTFSRVLQSHSDCSLVVVSNILYSDNMNYVHRAECW